MCRTLTLLINIVMNGIIYKQNYKNIQKIHETDGWGKKIHNEIIIFASAHI
jgi:hypothetical protein